MSPSAPQPFQSAPSAFSETGGLDAQRLGILAASPDSAVPISRPATDSATCRRSRSLRSLPTTGNMTPVLSTSYRCSGVISRRAAGLGARSYCGLPWQLRHLDWKMPKPFSVKAVAPLALLAGGGGWAMAASPAARATVANPRTIHFDITPASRFLSFMTAN